MVEKLAQLSDKQDFISVSILEKWVEQLLIHSDRDQLREAFVNLVSELYTPSQIYLFTNRQQSIIAHRGNKLDDLSVFDSYQGESSSAGLVNLPLVYKAVIGKNAYSNLDVETKAKSLYIPLTSGDIVNAVFVAEDINLSSEIESLWPLLYKSYRYLNNTLYSAEIDPLTGLMNRLTFEKLLSKSIAEHNPAENDNLAVFFALIDIDFFKSINDTFGHLYGDEVLVLLARYMKESFRSIDWLFRYGGEEFVVVIRDETGEGAFMALERFRRFIEQIAFPQMEPGQVTVSIGYSKMTPFDAVSGLIDRADTALYYVKDHGRNNTIRYEDLVEQGLLATTKQQADVELF